MDFIFIERILLSWSRVYFLYTTSTQFCRSNHFTIKFHRSPLDFPLHYFFPLFLHGDFRQADDQLIMHFDNEEILRHVLHRLIDRVKVTAEGQIVIHYKSNTKRSLIAFHSSVNTLIGEIKL